MKNTFAKKVLLIGAVAVGLSAVVPAHAMVPSKEEVREQAMNSTPKENEGRLKSYMRTLDKQYREFMNCVKGNKPCTFKQKAAIVTTLAGILVLVTVLGGHRISKAESARIKTGTNLTSDYTSNWRLKAGAPARAVKDVYRSTTGAVSKAGTYASEKLLAGKEAIRSRLAGKSMTN